MYQEQMVPWPYTKACCPFANCSSFPTLSLPMALVSYHLAPSCCVAGMQFSPMPLEISYGSHLRSVIQYYGAHHYSDQPSCIQPVIQKERPKFPNVFLLFFNKLYSILQISFFCSELQNRNALYLHTQVYN